MFYRSSRGFEVNEISWMDLFNLVALWGGRGGGLKSVESCIDSLLEMTVLEKKKKKVSIMILIYS